jgi:hypothetical protein
VHLNLIKITKNLYEKWVIILQEVLNFGVITDRDHIAVATPLHSDFQFQYLAVSWSLVHRIPTAGETTISVIVNLKRPSGTGQHYYDQAQ